ncbi:protease [Pedobacter petrophilus]|uniref:Protease n=1 Tax=Pedobacter petrophilus TaxID=1908241 RepID=A0A7K0FZL8_9SPHI|nr:protease [Pedobacter petrophilus]MRX76524.1 protease [Pedobacter petrophilus]
MKKIMIVAGLGLALFTACSSSKKKAAAGGNTDTTLVSQAAAEKKADPILGKLTVIGVPKLGGPINMRFTVYNNTDTVTKFCIWHTPFERLMSKYLDVAMDDYTPIDYKGAMAKRVMPPPADSYKKLNAGDSTSADFNLVDAYAITKAGNYTIKYNSSTISGIVVPDSLQIKVTN